MHQVDRTTDEIIRKVLARAENRLRLEPVPLDRGSHSPPELQAVLGDLISEQGRQLDEVLDLYSSVIAPSVISTDSPRFLGFIPAAPTKASSAFDALIACASLQGISWLEASGAIAAENSVLRLIADEAGLPAGAGGCFVTGGSAGNLSALAVARESAKHRVDAADRRRRWRVAVGTEAHSSVFGALRLLELEPLLVPTPDHRLTGEALAAAVAHDPDPSDVVAVVATSGTANAGIVDDLAGVSQVARRHGWWFHVDGAYGGAGVFAPSIRDRYSGLELADSFIVDPHKWLFAPYDCCALLYRDPARARVTHTQRAPYLEVIHTDDAEWNPADYAFHLTRRARGLPLWFSLAVHGVGAYREAMETTLELTRATADLISRAPQLELIREPDLGIVLFRRPGWTAADYHGWADALHQDQIAFAPPTIWENETVGRLAFLHPHTSLATVEQVITRTR
ncbi:MAG TPA: pyridoxal-dependent decarboxylase, partial [Microlunatus sp.]|nr:pyridoxal-dependent decarboxylase [Microlunatus sp.]